MNLSFGLARTVFRNLRFQNDHMSADELRPGCSLPTKNCDVGEATLLAKPRSEQVFVLFQGDADKLTPVADA